MTTATTLTSELEAINVLLHVSGEAPVSTLNTTGLLPLARARATLDEASRLVQSVGWAFNTDEDFTLSRDVNGVIHIPTNALKFDANDEYNWKYRPQQRGSKLYDAKNHTYTWPENIAGTMVTLLPWNELPQAARHYIMVKAARTFQARDTGSTTSDGFSEKDEADALLAMQEYELDTGDHNVLTGSLDTYRIIAGREEWA